MNRFQTAKIAQDGACNPIPLARGLQQAIYEIRDAGGDTNTILNDPACRLIVHQLAHLFRTYPFEDYAEAMNEVEAKCNESAS